MSQRTIRNADHESTYHPAFADPGARPLSAGQALYIIVVALTFALVFNSAGVLHLVRGMPEGPSKSIALAIVGPVDFVAHTVWLDRPKQGLDRIFGHELDATGGAGLSDGNDAILGNAGQTTESAAGLSPRATEPAIVAPTVADPLRMLVLGDSLSTFVGQQLDELANNRKLARVKEVFKDGTGINAPEFFNWQAAAQSEIKQARAQVVVMVIGGNDRQSMRHNGVSIDTGTAEWETEYARRVAVIMASMIDSGVQRIYWSGPPRARSRGWDNSYRRINDAVARAASAIPGARFVDLYEGTGSGSTYSDFATIDGKQVRVRQPDGIHWTFEGSRQPAELVAAALEKDYGNVL